MEPFTASPAQRPFPLPGDIRATKLRPFWRAAAAQVLGEAEAGSSAYRELAKHWPNMTTRAATLPATTTQSGWASQLAGGIKVADVLSDLAPRSGERKERTSGHGSRVVGRPGGTHHQNTPPTTMNMNASNGERDGEQHDPLASQCGAAGNGAGAVICGLPPVDNPIERRGASARSRSARRRVWRSKTVADELALEYLDRARTDCIVLVHAP